MTPNTDASTTRRKVARSACSIDLSTAKDHLGRAWEWERSGFALMENVPTATPAILIPGGEWPPLAVWLRSPVMLPDMMKAELGAVLGVVKTICCEAGEGESGGSEA